MKSAGMVEISPAIIMVNGIPSITPRIPPAKAPTGQVLHVIVRIVAFILP